MRAVARRNSYALVWAQFGIAHLVMLGGLALLALYQDMSAADFWLLVAISQALVSIDNVISIKLTRRMWRPVWAWEARRSRRGLDRRRLDRTRDPPSSTCAECASTRSCSPTCHSWRSRPGSCGWSGTCSSCWRSVGTAVLMASMIVRYFAMEVAARPVLEKLAPGLPADFTIEAPGLPLRWRLLAAAPTINIITGLVVAGLSTHGHHPRLSDLGIAWLIAVVVSSRSRSSS